MCFYHIIHLLAKEVDEASSTVGVYVRNDDWTTFHSDVLRSTVVVWMPLYRNFWIPPSAHPQTDLFIHSWQNMPPISTSMHWSSFYFLNIMIASLWEWKFSRPQTEKLFVSNKAVTSLVSTEWNRVNIRNSCLSNVLSFMELSAIIPIHSSNVTALSLLVWERAGRES